MSTNQVVTRITLAADADYSTTGQYLFVAISATGTAVLVASQGADAIGVLSNDPLAGDAAQVDVGGIVKVTAGDTITAGNKLTTGADGRAEVAATGDWVIGWAVTAGADGEIIEMLITHQDISA